MTLYKPYINHASTLPQSCPVPQPCHRNYSFLSLPCPNLAPSLTQDIEGPYLDRAPTCPNHVPYLNHAWSTLSRSCPRYFISVPQSCPNPTSVEKSRFYSFYRTLLLLFINKTQFSISLKLWELLFYQLINNIDLRTPATLKKLNTWNIE